MTAIIFEQREAARLFSLEPVRRAHEFPLATDRLAQTRRLCLRFANSPTAFPRETQTLKSTSAPAREFVIGHIAQIA